MKLHNVHPDWRDELLGLIATGLLMAGLFIGRVSLPLFGIIEIVGIYFYMGIAAGIVIVLVGFLLKKLMLPVITAAASAALWMVFAAVQPAGSVFIGLAFISSIASFPFIARLIALIPSNKRRRTDEN